MTESTIGAAFAQKAITLDAYCLPIIDEKATSSSKEINVKL
jgi:hypothetical protein